MTPDSKIQKLKDLLKLVDESLSRAEFVEAFKEVLAYIKKTEENLATRINAKLEGADKEMQASVREAQSEFRRVLQEVSDQSEQVIQEARQTNQTTLATLKKRSLESIDTLFTRLRLNDRFNALESQFQGKIGELNDTIQSVPSKEDFVALIPLEKTPEETRDGLETLEGEERLDARAIKNLPEATKQIVTKAGWGAHPLQIQDDGAVIDKVTRIINFTGGTVTRSADGVVSVPIGGDTDEKVKYNVSDTAAGYLADKIVAGTGISLAEGTGGDADKLVVTNSAPATIDGSGTTNELAYWVDPNTQGALAVASYPSLAETAHVKGVTSAIQTQINGKQASMGADDNYVTDAEKTVIGNTSGTNTGDNATNSQYSGLVTNATHTGDATGSGALTVVALNGTNLATLGTGVLKNTTTTGVPFISKVAITEPATASTLTIADGATLTASATASVSGTNTGDNAANTSSVAKATYDAHSILYATTDDTPVALTVGEQTVVGRATGGNIAAIAIDSDLSSVSANDDTIPSAKATKAMGDLKLPLAGGTMSGNITLGENTSVALDPAGSADGKYSGITVTGVAGYTQAFGDLVYLDPTDSRWEATDGNAAAAADGDARGVLGMVVVAGTDGNACTILLEGIIRADANFPALTVGAPVYVAETAGDIVVAQPTTTDAVIRMVGAALTADEIFFRPDFSYTTHT